MHSKQNNDMYIIFLVKSNINAKQDQDEMATLPELTSNLHDNSRGPLESEISSVKATKIPFSYS